MVLKSIWRDSRWICASTVIYQAFLHFSYCESTLFLCIRIHRQGSTNRITQPQSADEIPCCSKFSFECSLWQCQKKEKYIKGVSYWEPFSLTTLKKTTFLKYIIQTTLLLKYIYICYMLLFLLYKSYSFVIKWSI